MRPVEKPSTGGAEWAAAEAVAEWRLEELLAAGYESGDALLLAADREVDLHVAIDLPRRGCPHKTALNILL
jgi:hypothetical protein